MWCVVEEEDGEDESVRGERVERDWQTDRERQTNR